MRQRLAAKYYRSSFVLWQVSIDSNSHAASFSRHRASLAFVFFSPF
jgi:hypothetical protein